MPGASRRGEAGRGIRVRHAVQGDAAAIARVDHESWRTTYTGILPPDVVAQRAARAAPAEWHRRLLAPGTATWVARRGAEVVGFAYCGDARHRLEGLEAEIYSLYVLRDHQRRGAGRELLRACARHFVRHGQFGFYLWVLKANRARLFYEALGGAEAGEKSERLGMHSFAQVAYAWHDLTALVAGRTGGLPALSLE